MAWLVEIVVTLLTVSVALFRVTSGHGLMVDPPGRNTVLNYQRLGTSPRYTVQCDTNAYGQVNYNDRSNFCGGRGAQNDNDGKCSACGDNWSAPYPRKHDVGGTLVKRNIPTRVYLAGQVITTRISITASHLGNFEFRLCTLNEADEKREGRNDELTNCFEDASRYIVLKTEEGDARYTGPNGRIDVSRYYTVNLKLPDDVTCPRGCSIQWRYEAGNNNDQLKYQEHFVNCADIIIASCDDYQSGNIAEYCGFGPTDEVDQCDGGTGSQPPAPPSGGDSQNGDNAAPPSDGSSQNGDNAVPPSGGQASPPCDQGTNNDPTSGSQGADSQPTWDDGDTGNEPYAGTQYNDNNGAYGGTQYTDNGAYGDMQDTDQEPDSPYIASQESEELSASPDQSPGGTPASSGTCSQCAGLTCADPCCELRVSAVFAHQSGWCEQVCHHSPPHCPPSHCRTRWVVNGVCSRRLRLRDLLRGLLAQDEHGETQDEDGDGGQYGK